MENVIENPQQDVPEEVILHYIVKDYRRMFFEYNGLLDKYKAKREEAHILHEENFRLKKLTSQTPADTLAHLNEMGKEVVSLKEKIYEFKDKLREAAQQNKLLADALMDSDNRAAILALIDKPLIIDTKDDKERLAVAFSQMEKAVAELQEVKRVLIKEKFAITGDTKDDYIIKRRMNKACSRINAIENHIKNFFAEMNNIEIK